MVRPTRARCSGRVTSMMVRWSQFLSLKRLGTPGWPISFLSPARNAGSASAAR